MSAVASVSSASRDYAATERNGDVAMILLLYIVMNTTTSDHSVSEAVKELVRDISALVRSEVTMAKSELQDSMARLGTGAGLLGGAGITGLFAVEFLLL